MDERAGRPDAEQITALDVQAPRARFFLPHRPAVQRQQQDGVVAALLWRGAVLDDQVGELFEIRRGSPAVAPSSACRRTCGSGASQPTRPSVYSIRTDPHARRCSRA